MSADDTAFQSNTKVHVMRLIRAFVVVSWALAVSGCGGDRSRPAPTPPTAPSPPPTTPAPPAATPRSITVTCQASILSTPGEQTQCSALVTYSDRTIRDETGTVRWSAVPSTVATVSAGGLVTPVQAGVATIDAIYPGAGRIIDTSQFAIEVALPPIARVRGQSLWVQDLDHVSFDASESSSGKDQSYRFDFGDGVTKTEPYTPIGNSRRLFEHIYRERGTYVATLTIVDRQGRQATASTTIRIESLTGTWTNSQFNAAAGRNETRSLVLVQTAGGGLTGSYVHPEGNREPLTGMFNESGGIGMTLTSRTITFGGSDLDGNHFTNADFSQFRVAVKGGSADGQTLTFKRQ